MNMENIDVEVKRTPEQQLEECVRIQCSDGNWNYDPYMHGMANGMILALALLRNESPVYLDAPKEWLCDKQPSQIVIQHQYRSTRDNNGVWVNCSKEEYAAASDLARFEVRVIEV